MLPIIRGVVKGVYKYLLHFWLYRLNYGPEKHSNITINQIANFNENTSEVIFIG